MRLGFVDCDNATCSSGTATQVVENGDQFTGVSCPSSDDCKVSYIDSNGDFAFFDCNSEVCTGP